MGRRTFRVLLEWDADERVWVTHVPELDDLSTFGDTREEALANAREAIVGVLIAVGGRVAELAGRSRVMARG